MSDTENKSNGAAHGVQDAPVDTLILTYNRASDHLEIGGRCNSLDLMLDILSRATRVLESKWRAERVIELQQQLAEQKENARIAAALRGGKQV